MTKQQKNSNDFIKKVSRIFAYDLLCYYEHGGELKGVTASKVYELLNNTHK